MKPRILTIRALRALGFGEVCPDEPEDHANAGRRFSGTLFLATLIGLVLSVMTLRGTGLGESVLWVGGGFAVLVLLSLADVLNPFSLMALLVATWLVAFGLLIVDGRSAEVMLTHMLPVAVVYVARWCLAALDLALRVPLFIPAALVIVLAPLLTEDPWRLAGESRWRLALLGAIAIIPLVVLMLVRLRRTKVDKIFERAAEAVKDDSDPAIVRGVMKLRGRCLSREEWPAERELERYHRQAFAPHALPGSASSLAATVASGFRRRCAWRLLSLLQGTSALTYLLIYVLAAVAMPASLAEKWSGVKPSSVVVPGLDVSLPWWPYVGVAALFAIVAAVGFLAFAVTEDTYTTALVDAVCGRLAQDLIIAGAPYLFDGRGPAPPGSKRKR